MLNKSFMVTSIVIISLGMSACSSSRPKQKDKSIYMQKETIKKQSPTSKKVSTPIVYEKRSPKHNRTNRVNNGSFANKLSSAALGRLRSRVRYDGSYQKISYPWGDVPSNIGVCTDVVIRSYRKLGIDLQSQVHRDMSAAFNTYPNPRKWNLSRPDTNIDHRRVYNLRHFFARRGAALPITRNASDYRPGDMVTWMVGPDLPHIGIVVNKPSRTDPNRLLIVHNIARGPQIEDVLFSFPITGHYRYTPVNMHNIPQGSMYASRPSQPRQNTMNYAQLLEAANMLGTSSPRKKTNAQIVDQTDRLNSAPVTITQSKSNTVQLVNLSKEAVQELLKK